MSEVRQKEQGVSQPSIISSEQAAWFGPYQVYPQKRLVLEAERPLRLGSRALDILLVLLENAGKVVSKEQLIASVWPGSVVEEINLRVHISALRKALGDGQAGQRYIVTVPQRGYSLVAPISWRPLEHRLDSGQELAAQHNLPTRLTRLIGRDAVVNGLVRQLRQKRLITLVGPGGIGKTTVALRVAELLLGHYPQGMRLLDLAALSDPAMVPATLAAALNLPLGGGEPLDELADYLRDRKMLLVLDNCEHLIDAIAVLTETLLKVAPHLHILATSREILRAEGEHVHRLGPLDCPPSAGAMDREQALGFPALRLFMERALANQDSFELTDSELPLASDLCRRLDGIPLAIELAAAQVGALGLNGVVSQLANSFRLLTRGRRTALPRQQTLRATLDWSYELLTVCEQASLRRLSVFRGAFTLEAAAAVIVAEHVEPAQVFASLTQLVSKSLLNLEVSDGQTYYRLLDTTRTYAFEKLGEARELQATLGLHAEHCLSMMSHARQEWERTPTRLWLDRYARSLDDIRAALDWGLASRPLKNLGEGQEPPEKRSLHAANPHFEGVFNAGSATQAVVQRPARAGPHDIAIRLTATSAPLWQELSLLKEHGRYVGKALAALEAQPQPCPQLKMALKLVLGTAWYHTRGGTPETIEAFVSARQLAEQCNDVAGQLKALSGLMAVNLSCGHYCAALEQTRHFDKLCAPGAAELSLSTQRLRGLAQHFAGDQVMARQHAEHAIEHISRSDSCGHFTHGFGVQYDQKVAALTLLARILWLQGYPEQAWRMASQALEAALRIDHGTSICYTLALSGWVIAQYNGDTDAAGERLDLLLEQTQKHCLSFFHSWARQYARLAEPATGAGAAEQVPDSPGLIKEIMATLCPRFVDAPLLERAESGEAGWSTAEILRAKANSLLLQETPDQSGAEAVLRRALNIARRQGALAWELRSATSLAQLWRQQGRIQDAHALLNPVYGRFTEGFATPDLLEARRLLDELRGHTPA